MEAPKRSARPWQFPDTEVRVLGGDDNLLGKGAYGEVRKAMWRGLPVAAKRLHMLSGTIAGLREEEVEAVRLSFVQEMEMLSVLRHPNLLLFLGVSYDRVSRTPSWILTELMQTSLYEILHDQRLQLSLPEIIDISLGIVGGLQYLHGHEPPIIHRDVSSKNILIDGSRVKIADLGQAKFYDVAAARQTAAPGAIVYSAPEVLTGKYSPSIDIFSFGVLLVQMCSGEYPNIDTRPDHTELACKKFPCLQRLITSCISMDPSFRPTAAQASQLLLDIQLTPAYTGDSHEHGGGIIVERVFRAAQERAKEDGIERGKREAEVSWSKKYESMKVAAHKYRTKAKDMELLLTATQNRVTKAAEVETASRRATRELERSVEELREMLREQKEVAEQDIARLARENTQLMKNVAALERQEEALTKQVVSERRERSSLEAALRAISDRMQATRKNQTASEARSEAVSRMLESVEERLASRESELDEARATMEELRAKLASFEAECKTLGEKVASEHTMRQQMTIRMGDMKDSLVRQNDRVADMEAELQEARTQAEDAMMARDDALRQAADARAAVEEATAKLTAEADRGDGAADALGDTALDALLDETAPTPAPPAAGHGAGSAQALSTTVGGHTDGGGSNQESFLPPLDSRPPTGNQLTEVEPPPRRASDGAGAGEEATRGGRVSGSKVIVDAAIRLGLSEVIAAMRENPTRAGVQWRCLNYLREKASEGSMRSQIAIHGGIGAAMIAMQTFPTDANVQLYGARCIMNLCFKNNDNRTSVMGAGGPTVLVNAMKTFPDEAGVQSFACGALANLAHSDADVGIAIARDGGVDAVLMALRTFSAGSASGRHRVLQKACWAMLAMASSDLVASHIASRGGLEAVVAAMRSSDRAEVQAFGAWALANIAWSDPDVQQRAIDCGALEVCETALERHGASSAEVASKADLALKTITAVNRQRA